LSRNGVPLDQIAKTDTPVLQPYEVASLCEFVDLESCCSQGDCLNT
jgi:hypothetical protein